MTKSITHFLIIFFIIQQLKSQIYLKLTKMDITRFAMKLCIYMYVKTNLWYSYNLQICSTSALQSKLLLHNSCTNTSVLTCILVNSLLAV